MNKITLLRKGTNGAPEGSDQWDTFDAPPHSTILVDAQGKGRCIPFNSAFDRFSLLPAAAAAAGSDDLMLSLGTGTEVIARSAKGGVNVKTQASTPADNDNAMLKPVANSSMIVPITAASRPRFSTRVRLTAITEIVFGAGMDENLTSPVGSATAGEGAQFYFDPLAEVTTAAAAANWVCATKVNGTDAYIDSGVPVVAGRDYELAIQIGEDLKAKYYIDGRLVATSAAALTSGDSFGAVVGLQVNANPPDGQKDFDCRYVLVERFIG